MEDVGKNGRTVLFVSHNLSAVEVLCNKGIILQKGKSITPYIDATKVINEYRRLVNNTNFNSDLSTRSDRKGTGNLRFTSIVFIDEKGDTINSVKCGVKLEILIGYIAKCSIKKVEPSIVISDLSGEDLTNLFSKMHAFSYEVDRGTGYFRCIIPKLSIPPGSYRVRLFAQSSHEILDWVTDAIELHVDHGSFYGAKSYFPSGYSKNLTEHTWE